MAFTSYSSENRSSEGLFLLWSNVATQPLEVYIAVRQPINQHTNLWRQCLQEMVFWNSSNEHKAYTIQLKNAQVSITVQVCFCCTLVAWALCSRDESEWALLLWGLAEGIRTTGLKLSSKPLSLTALMCTRNERYFPPAMPRKWNEKEKEFTFTERFHLF